MAAKIYNHAFKEPSTSRRPGIQAASIVAMHEERPERRRNWLGGLSFHLFRRILARRALLRASTAMSIGRELLGRYVIVIALMS